MKTLLLFLLPLSLIFVACDKQPDPVVFNDSLVQYSNDADKYLNDLGTKVEKKLERKDTSTLDQTQLLADIKVAKDSVLNVVDKVKAIPTPADGEDFKNATLAYLESLVSQLDIYNEQYPKFSKDMTQEEVSKIYDILNATDDKSIEKLKQMIKVQTEFAKKNNIQLVM